MINQNARPDFHNYELGPDFERAREQIATPFLYVDIPLDNATSNAVYNVSGDFLYVDVSSTGTAVMELNNQYNDPAAPFLIQGNFAINAIFKQLKLSWAAQPGKKIRLMYSTGERVIPANTGVSNVTISGTPTISGSVSLVGNNLVEPSGYWNSVTAYAANTPYEIFNASANPNGAILINAHFAMEYQGQAVQAAFLAKATAPTSRTDGYPLFCSIPTTNMSWGVGQLQNPIKIKPGLGLYYINGYADNPSWPWKSCSYKLL